MWAETFWERVARLRRLRRVSLRTLGETPGRTEPWASRAVRGLCVNDVALSDGEMTRLADLLAVSRSKVQPGASGIVPVAALDGGPRLPVVNAVDAGVGKGWRKDNQR